MRRTVAHGESVISLRFKTNLDNPDLADDVALLSSLKSRSRKKQPDTGGGRKERT